MRFSIHQGPPQDAERYKTLAWVRNVERVNFVTLKVWRGKALKPFAYYSFSSAAKADEWLEGCKRMVDRDEAVKVERKAAKSDAVAKMRAEIKVGTILHYSWGYDQTQCEYFEVIERRGAVAVIREIGSRTKEGSESFMSDSQIPMPGKFIGPPLRKIIGAYGIAMDHGTATPTDPNKAHYRSWYA